jgi:hypothetical protein
MPLQPALCILCDNFDVFHFVPFIQHSTDAHMVSPLDIEHVIQKEIVIKSSNKRQQYLHEIWSQSRMFLITNVINRSGP